MGIFKLFKNSSQGSSTKSVSDPTGFHPPGSEAAIPERSFKGPKRAIRPSTKGDGVALQTIPYATLTRDTQQPTPSRQGSSRSISLYTEAYKNSDTRNTPAEPHDLPLQRGMGRMDNDAHSLMHDRESHASRLASTSSTLAADDEPSPGTTSRPAFGYKADIRQRRSLFSLRSFSGGKDVEDNRLGERTRNPPTGSGDAGQSSRLDSGTNVIASSKQPRHRQGSELDVRPRLASSTPLASPGFTPQGNPLQSKSVALTETPASDFDDRTQGSVQPQEVSASPDNSYFEVRNFRQVSGTGGSSWQRSPALLKPQNPSSPASRPDAKPTSPDHEEILFESARPTAPKLSRPPSFAGSIGGEEPARQVSAHMFRQARRQSTSSVFTLEAYQQPDDPEDSSSRNAVPVDQSVRLRRTSTHESSIEMLASPDRKPLGTPRSDTNQDRPSPLPTRSSYDRQTTNDQVSPAKRGWEFPQKGLEPAAQILPKNAVNPERGMNRAADVTSNQRRAFSFGGAVAGEIGPSADPGLFGNAQAIRLRNNVIKTHDRSQSTSAMPVTTPDLLGQTSSTNRIPLSERLMSATSGTPSSAWSPDIVIPPVNAQSRQLQEGLGQKRFPSSSFLSKGAACPDPDKSSPVSSPVRKQRLRQGWDSSSSDDSDKGTGAHSRSSSKSKTTQPWQRLSNTARSLPSGVRKPPPPSEAFGSSDWEGASPRRPMKAGSRTPSSHSIRSLSVKPTSTHGISTTGRSSQFEDKSDSSGSSSDESLAVILRKRSGTSLKAQFAASTPNLTSPGRQPVSSGSARSPPMKSAMKGVSAPETLTARSAGQRALPVPPLAPALSANPLLSAFDQTHHVWPRESPALSQSGTTGEASSRNGPLTPQDMSMVSQTVSPSAPSIQHEDRFLGSTSRRVSFMNAQWDRSSGNLDSDARVHHIHGRQAPSKTGSGPIVSAFAPIHPAAKLSMSFSLRLW